MPAAGSEMITIVDYNGGNLRSVKRACDAVGIDSVFTSDPEAVAAADRIIFPGVGHAKAAMSTLRQSGLAEAMKTVHERGVPILGICVGAQLILDSCEEGPTDGLGLIPGQTRRFNLSDRSLKIPHMGWNEVRPTSDHPLLGGIRPGDAFYFVHSYFPCPTSNSDVFAETDYPEAFCCALGRDNLFATQFHPEKSGRLGLELLARFASWNGSAQA